MLLDSVTNERIDRLCKRAVDDRACAKNSKIVYELLQPQLELFNQRGENPHNVYAVRMALDHKHAMERDNQNADDLEWAVNEILRLNRKNND